MLKLRKFLGRLVKTEVTLIVGLVSFLMFWIHLLMKNIKMSKTGPQEFSRAHSSAGGLT